MDSETYAATFSRSQVEIVFRDNGKRELPRARLVLGNGPSVSDKAATADPAPEIRDGAIILPRGEGIEERWIPGAETLEQIFVLSKPPALPEIRIPFFSDASAAMRGDEIRFGDAITYGGLEVHDAAGRPIRAGLVLDAGEIVIALDADDLARASYPVTVDPTIASGPTNLSAAGGDDFEPTSAFDSATAGGRYCIVWERAGTIYRAVRAADGTPVAAPAAIPLLTAGAESFTTPAIAFSPAESMYIVVARGSGGDGGRIVGAVMDTAGTQLSTVLGVVDTSGFGLDNDRFPWVAYNGDDGDFMCVWEMEFSATDGDIYNATATIDAGNNVAFIASTIDTTATNHRIPFVSYRTGDGGASTIADAATHYGVVAIIDDANNDLTFRSLSRTGSGIGSFTGSNNGFTWVALSYTPATDEWLSINISTGATATDLFADLMNLDMTARTTGPVTIRDAGATAIQSAFALYSATNAAFYVSWSEGSGANDDILGRMVSASLATLGTTTTLVSGAADSDFPYVTYDSLFPNPSPATAAAVQSRALLTYSDNGPGAYDVFFAVLNLNTTPAPAALGLPADLAAGVAQPVTLSWTEPTDADGDESLTNYLRFDILLDTSNPPTTVVASDLTALSFTTSLQPLTTYFWKVRARDPWNGSTDSTVRSFTTGENGATQIQVSNPVTAGAASDDHRFTFMRRSAYGQGRWWELFTDFSARTGTIFYSANGTSWTGVSITNISALDLTPDQGSVWLDSGGAFLYLVLNEFDSGAGGPDDLAVVRVNMSTATVEGAIAVTDAGENQQPSMCVDSAGNFWLASVGGIWRSTTGWNGAYSSTLAGVAGPILLPLDAGRVYVVYVTSASTLTGRLWDGTAWSAPATIASDGANIDLGYYSATVDGNNDIHLVYQGVGANHYRYIRRTNSTGAWDAASTPVTSATAASPEGITLTYFDQDDELWAFSIQNATDEVFYSRVSKASASTSTAWQTWTTTGTTGTLDHISSNMRSEATVVFNYVDGVTIDYGFIGPRTLIATGAGAAFGTAASWMPGGTRPSATDSIYVESINRSASPSLSLDVAIGLCRSIRIPGGSMFSHNANTLRVYGNFRNSGIFTTIAGSLTEFRSNSSTSASVVLNTDTDPFYNVDLIKSALAHTLTCETAIVVSNSLTVTEGTLDLDDSATQLAHTVSGNFAQNGGSLRFDSIGTTSDLPAHLTVSGTFTVTAGTFTGSTAIMTQEINAEGNVTIAVGWNYHGWFRLRGPPDDVGATLRTFSGKVRVLDVQLRDLEDLYDVSSTTCEYVTIANGELRVPAGGTLTVTNQTEAGFATADGAAGELGAIRFDGDGTPGNRRFTIAGTVSCHRVGWPATGANDGTFGITAGTLAIALSPGGFKGDFVFDNTNTLANASPILKLEGGTIRLVAGWLVQDADPESSLTFSASAGTVEFNGASAQSIAHSPEAESLPGQGTAFFNLTINNSAVDDGANPVTLAVDLTAKNVLTITDGRLRIAGPRILTLSGAVAHLVAGKLDLEASGVSAATLRLAHGASLSVSGLLEATRAVGATANAVLEIPGADGAGWSMSVSGTIDAKYFTFTDLGAVGIAIPDGGTILRLHEGTLTKEAALAGPCLDLSAVTGVNRSRIPYTLSNLTFAGTSGENAKAGMGTPVVSFLGGGGGRWGETFDTDPLENELGIASEGRLLWLSAQIQNVDTGATYGTVEAALLAAVANERIRPLRPIILSDLVEFPLDAILERFVLAPQTGLAVDGGSSLLGSLQNCVILRGGADFVRLRNCTVFDPSAAVPATTNCVAYNTVFEEAAPGLTTDVNNLKSAAASLFVDAAGIDFHLAVDDAGTTAGTPVGWVGPSEDFEGHARTGNWDRGVDEFFSTGVQKLGVDTGYVSRFHLIGGSRGSTSAANGFAYLTSQAGSGTAANNNTLYVVNLSTMAVVAQTPAVGPVLGMAFWVDVTNTGASWRAWIYLVVDTDNDGHGDAIQLVVDKGDGGLVHPDQPLTDPDPTLRRFGSVAVGSRFVYRPGAAGEYRIRWITLATVPADGADDDPGVVHNSPVGTNKARWNRMFFAAYKTTATTGGSLFKVNADPYDTNSVSAPDNQAFGETLWQVLPGNPSWYNFDYRGTLTFTWASGFQEIFVPVSESSIPAQTVLVRYSMAGTSPPVVSRCWQATEESAPVDENRFGATLDNGNTNATCVYAMSDGTVIYNRGVDSASGSAGLRWASRLKNGAGTPQTPVLGPQRFWPNAFALVAYDGGVNKVWSLDGADPRNGSLASSGLKLDLVTPLNEIPQAGTQDLDWPMACIGKPVQKVWVRSTKIYFGTDRGYVYGRTWNRDGSSTAAGDETLIAGYPYAIPGARVTWVFVHPTAGVLVGTDSGGFYRFAP